MLFGRAPELSSRPFPRWFRSARTPSAECGESEKHQDVENCLSRLRDSSSSEAPAKYLSRCTCTSARQCGLLTFAGARPSPPIPPDEPERTSLRSKGSELHRSKR